MSVEQIQWPEDIPFTGIPITNFEAGVVSDVFTIRIFNDRGQPAAGNVLRNNSISVANQDPTNPSNKLTSGIAPMDELWSEVRFTDASPNIVPFISAWTRLGAFTILPFPEMISDSWRQFEWRFRPPSFALTNPYVFFTHVHTNERAFGVQGPSVDRFRGVVDGWRDSRQHTLLSGAEITASPVPDDNVNFAKGHMIFGGRFVGYIDEVVTIDDFDGDGPPQQLLIGESYIVMYSRNADGTLDEVKGLKGTTPVAPVKLPNKIFNAFVEVTFTGGVPIIVQGDITETLLWGHYYLTEQGGLVVRLNGGNLVSSGTWRTTFEFEDFTLVASDDNYLWSRSDGSFSVDQNGGILPDGSSDLLYKITTDVTDVTAIEDRRSFLGATTILELDGELPNTPGIIDEILFFAGTLEIFDIILQLDDNPGTAGSSIFDVLVNSVSIYPNPLLQDLRPTFPFATVNGVDSTNLHQFGTLQRGDRITLSSIQYPTGPPPPGIVRCFLYCK